MESSGRNFVKHVLSNIARSTCRGVLVAILGGGFLATLFYLVCGLVARATIIEATRPKSVRDIYKVDGSASSDLKTVFPFGQKATGSIYFLVSDLEIEGADPPQSDLSDASYLEPIPLDGTRGTDTQKSQSPTEFPSTGLHGITIGVFKNERSGEGQTTKRIMLIEMRQQVREGLYRSRVALQVDVAIRQDGEWKRVPWWQTDGIAPSGSLFEADTGLQTTIAFPTTISALSSWMKERWLPVTDKYPGYDNDDQLKLTRSEVVDLVAPTVEKILSDHAASFNYSGAISAARILNGRIQMVTFTVFFAAILIIFARTRVFVINERKVRERMAVKIRVRSQEDDTEAREAMLAQCDRTGRAQEELWGHKSSFIEIWRGSLLIRKAGNDTGATEYIESLAALEEDIAMSRGFSLRYLVGAIPAIGFVGTVYGIGLALMGTGSVLSDFLAKQQSGVGSVALSLGIAFDTTLVALILSLVVLLFSNWLDSEIEGEVAEARKLCLRYLAFGELQNPAECVD